MPASKLLLRICFLFGRMCNCAFTEIAGIQCNWCNWSVDEIAFRRNSVGSVYSARFSNIVFSSPYRMFPFLTFERHLNGSFSILFPHSSIHSAPLTMVPFSIECSLHFNDTIGIFIHFHHRPHFANYSAVNILFVKSKIHQRNITLHSK